MKLTIPALNALMEKLEAQPTLTSTTPGPKCPECGAAFIVGYGRRSKKWLVLHGGGVSGLACSRYESSRQTAATQAEAIALAEGLAK